MFERLTGNRHPRPTAARRFRVRAKGHFRLSEQRVISVCLNGKASGLAEHHDTQTALGNQSRSLSDQGQLAADRGRGGKRVRERERESSNRYDRTFVATAGSLSLHELSL